LKKLKINYLLIGIVTLLLAVASGLLSLVRQSRKPYRRHSGAGELRVSTLNSPLIYSDINGKTIGWIMNCAQQFADYLGVKLKITVRQNISQLFDDLDNDDADMLAAGLVYNSERSKTISQAQPTTRFAAAGLPRRELRPRSLASINDQQLTIAPAMW
jgi:membrane-bound lytic murein transglycosylase F